jgi:hypothetical protein
VDELLWLALFIGILLAVGVHQLVIHGGFRGALFGARIRSTVGEMDLDGSGFTKRKLLIYRLEPGSAAHIGIELRQRTLGSYQVEGISLSKSQARTLCQLLAKAAEP